MMSIPTNNLKLAVEMATRVESALAKRVGDQPETQCATPQQATPQLKTQFEINDLPDTDRILLTSKSIQNDIEEFSGTVIVTRGRYLTPKEKNQASSERSLHLLIKGPKKQNLDLAIQKIQSLIQRDKDMSKQPNLTSGPLINGAGIEKVLIGLDHAPPSFDLRNKILGLNGANLHYIMNETGAVVTMRGRGSGFIEANGQESVEPLHLCVEHAKNEVLQNGRQLAFNLIETIQNEYSATYASNHVAPPPNVPHQPTNVHIQQPQVIHQTIQTNNGQLQQINPAQYQTVQVAAQSGMMTLQDGSQVVQTSLPNVQMPLFTQQAVPQIMAVPPPVIGGHQQQTAQNTQGPTHIASLNQHQASILPQIQTQVINQQQQHQLPLSVTPVSYSTIQPQQQPQQIQQQAIQTKSLENVQHTPSVTHTTPTSLANGVIPHTQAFMTQATLPIQYIQTSNGQIIAYQPQVQSNTFQMAQTPNVGQVAQLSQPTNTGLIGTTYILGSQMTQYQQPSGQPGQVMIVQYQQPQPAEIQQPAVQTIHLQQTQSGQLIPANIPNGQLIVQQTPGQPAQIQMMMPQLNQFQNLQPQIIQNLPGLLQSQVSQASTQQLLLQQQGKTFTQQTAAPAGNQLMSLPISHQILQSQGNGIVTMTLPQQQQPQKPQHQVIQTQIADKQQIIYKQDDNQPIMIQQGQQQSIQYYQQSNQFQYQPLKRSYEMVVSEGGGISGAKIIRTGQSPITGNDGSEDNQIRQVTINGMVATSSTGRRTPQANFQHQLAPNASNITGDPRSKECSNMSAKEDINKQVDRNKQQRYQFYPGRGYEPDQRSGTPVSEPNRPQSVTFTVLPDPMRNQAFTPAQTVDLQQQHQQQQQQQQQQHQQQQQQQQQPQATITYQTQQQIPSYWIQQGSSPQEGTITGTPPPKEGTLHYVD